MGGGKECTKGRKSRRKKKRNGRQVRKRGKSQWKI